MSIVSAKTGARGKGICRTHRQDTCGRQKKLGLRCREHPQVAAKATQERTGQDRNAEMRKEGAGAADGGADAADADLAVREKPSLDPAVGLSRLKNLKPGWKSSMKRARTAARSQI
jgi:hypothetical protein